MNHHADDAAEPTPPAEQGEVPDPATGPDEGPRLWNPNAAGLWSLLFSPAFGAFLHARNWRSLGHPERAQANMAWFWCVLVFLFLAVATVPLGDIPALDRAFQIGGVVLLILWFYRQCKPQMTYVKAHFGDAYPRRGWGIPLGIGAGAIIALLIAILALTIITYEVQPEALVEIVQPQILADWQNNPAIDDATVERFTLEPAGEDRFTGTISATLNGQPEQFQITIDLYGEDIMWRLNRVEP